MKKINFKGFFVLLLCAVMLFAFCSCGDTPEECTVHTDEDGDGKCDVCKGEIPKEPASENDGDSDNSEASDSSADAQTSEQTANGKKKGCRSTVIGASVCVLVLTTIVGSSLIRKKKED